MLQIDRQRDILRECSFFVTHKHALHHNIITAIVNIDVIIMLLLPRHKERVVSFREQEMRSQAAGRLASTIGVKI